MRFFPKSQFLRRAWRYRRYSEKFTVAFVLSLDLTDRTVLDIGANRGIYSYWLHKKVGKHGSVIAFEPQPELSEHLNWLKQAFRLTSLTVANLGLSSTTTTRSLTRPRDHWGGASLETRSAANADILEVGVTTLDDYLHEHSVGPIGFIKCDVEGHEGDVFRGARRTLENDRPDIAFECGNPSSNCPVFSYLESLEYDCLCFHRGGFTPTSRYDEIRSSLHRKATHDFVAVPREKSHAFMKRAA